MAYESLFSITINEQSGPLSITLDSEYNEYSKESIDFVIIIKSPKIDTIINASANLTSKKITTTLSITTDPLSMCIGACVAKGIIEPLIECFDTDIDSYLNCLKSKGVTIASDTIKCIIDCCVAIGVTY